jgi:hypothetical protein
LPPQPDTVVELPGQHGPAGIDDLLDDDEARYGNLSEHVAENPLDGGYAAHIIEGVDEMRVGGVKLGDTTDARRGERFVPGGECVQEVFRVHDWAVRDTSAK